jgi:hypothetical protein
MIEAFGAKRKLDPARSVLIYELAAELVVDGKAHDTSCYAIQYAQSCFRPSEDFEQIDLKELFADYFKPIGTSYAYWFEDQESDGKTVNAENNHRCIALLLMAQICRDLV